MHFWRDLRFDLSYALRQIWRRPAFAITCVAVLAFGMGANMAIFSMLHSAVLKALPYAEPDRLVAVHNRYPQVHLLRIGTSPYDFKDLEAHRELFTDAGVYFFLDLSRTGVERPTKVNAVAASGSLFRTLRVSPLLGRNFTAAEEQVNGPHAVIVSEGYWEREFGRDPQILDRTLQLDGSLYRVVGVMPKSLQFPNAVTEMWTPAVFKPELTKRGATQPHFLHMYARLAPGLSFAGAAARIDELSLQLGRDYPDDFPVERMGWRYFLLPMEKDDDGSLRYWMYLLSAAVGCLLLIVCTNVAGLLLVRSAERRFEFSVRVALGANRWRLVRQAITEVLLLSLAGGLAAVWIARTGVHWMTQYKPIGAPSLDPAAYGFLAAMVLITALACGVVPAWAAAGAAIERSLKEARHQRLRYGLIAGQVAIATTLLVSGGLLVRSLLHLLDTSPGFDANHLLTMEVTLPSARYRSQESRSRFLESLLAEVRQIPGVEDAAACTNLPFGYGENVNTFEIVGQPKMEAKPFAILNNASPDYFRTMRIPLLRGRSVTEQDRLGSANTVVIDATMAERYFARVDPIGQQIRMGWGVFTVVGVAGSVKISGLDIANRPVLYFSVLQWPSLGGTLVVRSALAEEAVVQAVEHLVQKADRDLPVYNVSSMQRWIDRSLETRRIVVLLIVLFGVTGTALAALGLYGVLSYTIALRRREIGIRMMLGADSGRIASFVGRHAARMVGVGLTIGSAGAVAAHRVLATQLYGTRLLDGLTWLIVLLVIGASCGLAAVLPARRAVRVNPVESLRDV